MATIVRLPAGSADEIPVVPPMADEISMALSAAPSRLQAGAGVYALRATGFEQVRASTNGFTCIVNRDHPRALKPTCYDAEGTATVLPTVLFEGVELMKGTPIAEIDKQIVAGLKNGRFTAPRRPGVAYMLSGHIHGIAPDGTGFAFPPHVMFYAPNLSDRDIGSDGSFSEGLPSIGYDGPLGFMIVRCAALEKHP
ncbi:MAG: hypothetical protein M3R30_01620 [Candidatus Eremiobacteraeota bacterium]|nr:hypothetical protein [Candidatus Eremiobacteraeota bacterium]